MKKEILYIGVFLVSCAVTAQTDCPFYQTYLKKGKDELQKGEKADFKKAIEAFSNAMIHCPAKADEARGQIVLAFDAINALKKRAEKDRIAAKQDQLVALQRFDSSKIKEKIQKRITFAEISSCYVNSKIKTKKYAVHFELLQKLLVLV
jgi:hypothetical protein